MFGLMKPLGKKTFSIDPVQENKSHNCSLCKAIGHKYGHLSRFTLNDDVIFLVDLIIALSNENTSEWPEVYKNKKCFALPKKNNQIPSILSFGADINALFTGIKIRDNKEDTKKVFWKLLDKLYQAKNYTSENNLQDKDFDIVWLKKQLQTHQDREQLINYPIEFYSEITALITGKIFAFGAKLIEKPELNKKFQKLGEEFGQLVYLIDAFKDYEKDVARNNFNAIKSSFGLEQQSLNSQQKKNLTNLILDLCQQTEHRINELPIPFRIKKSFIQRVKVNTNEALGLTLNEACATDKPRAKMTLKKRLQLSNGLFKLLNNKHFLPEHSSISSNFKLVSLAIFVFFIPQHLNAIPDFINNFSSDQLDAINNLLGSFNASTDCCECRDNCDTCCNNCGSSCNDFIEFIVRIFYITIILLIGIVIFSILFLVNFLSKNNKKSNGLLAKIPKNLLNDDGELAMNKESVQHLTHLITIQQKSIVKKHREDIINVLNAISFNRKTVDFFCLLFYDETGKNLINELKSLSTIENLQKEYLGIFIRLGKVEAKWPFKEVESREPIKEAENEESTEAPRTTTFNAVWEIKQIDLSYQDEYLILNDNAIEYLINRMGYQKGLFLKPKSKDIIHYFDAIEKNKKQAYTLCEMYYDKTKRELIDDLYSLSTSYDTIKEYLHFFIVLGFVEANFPYKKIIKWQDYKF